MAVLNKALLFLDLDGVINSRNWYDARQSIKFPEGTSHRFKEIDPILLGNLWYVIDSTDCEIVISSAWRYSSGNRKSDEDRTIAELKPLFAQFGYDFPIIGCTPSFDDRGKEINAWMKEKGFEGHYAIVDDDVSDITPYHSGGRIVKTSHVDGLTLRKAEELIAALIRSRD